MPRLTRLDSFLDRFEQRLEVNCERVKRQVDQQFGVLRTVVRQARSRFCGARVLTARCAEDTIALNKILDQDKKMASLMKTIENYQSLLESCKLSDVVFVIGEKEFKLHKAILSAQSPVFSAMFTNDLSEAKQNRVDLIDVDVEVFEAMILFIYTGNVDSVQQYALELFVVADKYQLDSLKDICAHFLGSNLTTKSVTNILLVADIHSAQELKSKCVQYINSNAEEVVLTAEWNQMAKDNNSTQLLHLLYLDLVSKSKGFKQVKL